MTTSTRIFAGGHDASVHRGLQRRRRGGRQLQRRAHHRHRHVPDVGDKVVVFAYSPEIPNDGISVRGDLPELKEEITQALLDYAAHRAAGRSSTRSTRSASWCGRPARSPSVEQAATELGITE